MRFIGIVPSCVQNPPVRHEHRIAGADLVECRPSNVPALGITHKNIVHILGGAIDILHMPLGMKKYIAGLKINRFYIIILAVRNLTNFLCPEVDLIQVEKSPFVPPAATKTVPFPHQRKCRCLFPVPRA